MKHVLDKLLDRGFVLLVGCQSRRVQQIDDWSLLQEREIGHGFLQGYEDLGEPLTTGSQ
jgi:hypothetical protein